MSMWGFARNATKSYLSRLNAERAVSLVKGSMARGKMAYGAIAPTGGRMMGAAGFGKYAGQDLYRGMKNWAWTSPKSALTRSIRVGTAAAAVGGTYGYGKMLGGIRGNMGRQEKRYGPIGPMGPSPDQTKRILDDSGISYS